MPDENEKQEGQSLSPSDLVRLKHQLGKNITWGKSNLNALQVEKLTNLSREDYARIRKEYADWHKHSIINTFVLALIMLGCVLGCVLGYSHLSNFWMRGAAIGLGVSCFYTLCKRIGHAEGHAEGYVDGYDAGHETGIHKTLGIQPEEMERMRKMGTEMRIDEMLVKGMDERKERP